MENLIKDEDNNNKNKKEDVTMDKMNDLINILNINLNKKEDDLKNISNEKDKTIKEMKDKIISQEKKSNL